MPKLNKYDKAHLRNMTVVQSYIDRAFKQATEAAARLGVKVKLPDPDTAFRFEDYPTVQKQFEAVMETLRNAAEVSIINAVRSSWTLSNNKNNELCNHVFGTKADQLSDAMRRRYYSNNDDALQAFLTRKSNGLGLSDRVWQYTNSFKTEIELGLDMGIRSGLDAASMARDLKQYLKYPDKLFRRVRDERGQLHLSKAAAEFHPGRGVYRSSYKNARRLAVTETNMAYHTADYLRWQQMDFVVGIEVRLSSNHTLLGGDGTPHEFADICDELQGRYPKDFKFTGWHPHCRCFAVSILKTEEEMEQDTQRILNGEEPTPSEDSENAVSDVPQAFKDHIEKYADTIKAVDNNRLPYYVQDNREYVDTTTTLLNSITVGKETYVLKDLIKECTKIQTGNGAVYAHPLHGKAEYAENLRLAQWRADEFGEQVILLPKSNNGVSADSYNLTRKVMEEYKVNSTPTISAIDNALRGGAKQANYIILEIGSDIKVGDFTDALTNRLKRCKNMKELRIKIGDCEAVYTKDEIIEDGFKIKPEDFHIGPSLRSQGVQLSLNTIAKLENFFGTAKGKI
jgi:hypothetical protein